MVAVLDYLPPPRFVLNLLRSARFVSRRHFFVFRRVFVQTGLLRRNTYLLQTERSIASLSFAPTRPLLLFLPAPPVSC